MKQNEKNDTRLTLANFISFGLGLAAFAVFFWLGLHFSGFELATSLLCSLGATIVFGLLLWLMIRAKSADRERSRWRSIEYVTLVCYVVFAACSIWPMSRFFSVNSKSDEIKSLAMEDVAHLQALLTEFKDKESEKLNRTITGMENYVSSRPSNGTVSEIERYFEDPDHKATMNRVGVEAYRTTWSRRVNDCVRDDKAYAATWRVALQEADRQIASWNILKVPASVAELDRLALEIGTTLTEISDSFPFPIIEQRSIRQAGQGSRYGIIMVNAKRTFDEVDNLTIVGVSISILIHLLILFNYFVANRSRRLEAGKSHRKPTGGILLTD